MAVGDLYVDVIVFGADISQLKRAVALAEDGKKVMLLTKNNVAGGEFAGFRRGRIEFRTAFGDHRKSGAECSGPQTVAVLENKLRDLGGMIRYKAALRQIFPDADGKPVAELFDGTMIHAEERHGLIFPQEIDDPQLTVKVLLAVDIPYSQLQTAAELVPGMELSGEIRQDDAAVFSLTAPIVDQEFINLSLTDYYPAKDRIADRIVQRFEEISGLKLSGHVLESEVITPFTLSRYLDETPFDGEDPVRTLAEKLHPPIQYAKVLKVTDRGHARSFVIAPDPKWGTSSLAYFRAGQYISIVDQVGEALVCKPYSICSSPNDSLGEQNSSTYTVMIERNPEGFFSPHALDTWKPGTPLVISGPLGSFYYQKIRDARHVMALAGSSGITPFFSMAAAIADGIEDFDLTILYGSRTAETILLRDELEAIAERSNGKVRVIHVLSDEMRDGYENGFISVDLIRKYAPKGDYSVFICGPKAMYDYLHRELPKLGLPEGRIRFELPGEFGDPSADPDYSADAAGQIFTITVREKGIEKTLNCRSDQTLMQAIERAGILMEADCRSGQCGWCRSYLISGKVFIPRSRDGRRKGDAESGWIHPCVTYPMSDVVLEVYNH